MTDREHNFSAELILNLKAAEGIEGYDPTALIKAVEAHGGVSCVKRALQRKGSSDSFDVLKKNKKLELTMEALVIKSEYASLFEDEDVNLCLELLVEAGYFG